MLLDGSCWQIAEAGSPDTKEKMRAVTKELEAELAKLPQVLPDRSGGAVAVATERA
eukprot:COSAG02_NODE_4490_length_5298_cov_15.339104_3_plen_56_part_00